MNTTTILLFDFNSLSELGETLKAQLCAMAEPLAAVHPELLNGQGMPEAIGTMTSLVTRMVPHLVILMLSKDAQAAAGQVFDALLGKKPAPPILAVPWSEEPDMVNELIRLGASDFVLPPFRPSDVQPRIQRLLAYRHAESMPGSALKETLGLQEFVGESPALLEQIRRIPPMARCDACVLITGETGTGKELCARAVHYLSPRANRPFVPLNCGAIPGDLLENELFGHEAGAFTSANASRVGVIQEAEGGTLFLDEIDSLPLSAQVKLLRFLQEKAYRPLGSGKSRTADVRIIAASNGVLENLLKEGKLRQDLFYRLNVLPLHLPPLRQRKEDIPLLARHFLAKYAAESNAPMHSIAPPALRKLSLHNWPGNVRELENVIERAIVLCAGDVISSTEIDLPVAAELPAKLQSMRQIKNQVVADFEQNYLVNVLHENHGNIAQAARAAQKDRRVFFRLMRKHHIHVERLTDTTAAPSVVRIVIAADKNVPTPIRL